MKTVDVVDAAVRGLFLIGTTATTLLFLWWLMSWCFFLGPDEFYPNPGEVAVMNVPFWAFIVAYFCLYLLSKTGPIQKSRFWNAVLYDRE